MKKLLNTILIIALILPLFHLFVKKNYENEVRSNVVMLLGKKGGQCTGTQIIAPSGHKYILTAAHCDPLIDDGKIMVKAEGMRAIPLAVVEDSETTDLMLLEPHPALSGIKIGSMPTPKDNLHAYTHGGGLDTYDATGKIIQEYKLEVMDHVIADEADEKECLSKPKNSVKDFIFFFIPMKACVLNMNSYITTLATIVPGSSGGAVVVGNKVVGVVSAVGNGFTFISKYSDLKEFLAAY